MGSILIACDQHSTIPCRAESALPVDYSRFDDEDLVELIAHQDVAALDALYSRHARASFALALKMLGDRELAEEVVQDAFLKLWRRPEAFVRQRGRLLPWLLGVTHNRAVDLLRHRQIEARHHVASDPGEVTDGSVSVNPEAYAWSSFRAEAVARALASLPVAQRQALELAYFRGLTQSEIAAVLNEPLGTVKTRIRLALQKLRSSLEMQALRTEAEEV